MAASRGALIVFEGCDKAGKSTQCQRLVEGLKKRGICARTMKFPDRSTAIGQSIDAFLTNQMEMEDHCIHLLFASNRWERVPEMKRLLLSGTSLVVDRYAFSGVAFTAAKQIASLEWCKAPDVGIPAPDIVFYLKLSSQAARNRAQYGSERYEQTDFQEKVAKRFEELYDDTWLTLDASRDIDDLHSEILETAVQVIHDKSATSIGELWTNQHITI